MRIFYCLITAKRLTLQQNYNNMNNNELLNALASKLGKPKADIIKLMDAFVGAVQVRCGELDAIALPGFGTFEGIKHDEHITIDKTTGKKMLMPPMVKMEFKVSNSLNNKLK